MDERIKDLKSRRTMRFNQVKGTERKVEVNVFL